MKTYVFPGQGSQKKGMGENLFDEFRELTAKANEILGYDIKKLCLEDSDNLLAKTDHTQPALYVVNAFTWLKTAGGKKKPDFTAGHSLGEYNALFAAGAFDFETGLAMVKERGRLMSLAKDGGMAAIIGADEEKIKEIIGKNGFQNIFIANYNSPSQIVVSGTCDEIKNAASFFKAAGVIYIVLNVSGAFHSPYMHDAAKDFRKFIERFELNDLKIPVIANATAEPYKKKEAVKKLLAKQMISPVRWTDTILYLIGKDVDEFEEIGPGKILTKLIGSIRNAL